MGFTKRLNLYSFRYCVTDKPIIGDLDDVAKNTGNLTILIDLFNILNMNALKKMEAVTLFAPSDEAFKKLPAHTKAGTLPSGTLPFSTLDR